MGVSYFNHFLIKGQAYYFQSGSSVTALGRASVLHMWRMLVGCILKSGIAQQGTQSGVLHYDTAKLNTVPILCQTLGAGVQQ